MYNNIHKYMWLTGNKIAYYIDTFRDAGGGGGAGKARAPQSFGISVNPIRTKGGRLCPPYYYWPPHLFGRCGVSVIHTCMICRTCQVTMYICSFDHNGIKTWLKVALIFCTSTISRTILKLFFLSQIEGTM